MKTKIILLLAFGLACLFSMGQNKFAYYQNSSLYVSSLDGDTTNLGSDIKIKIEKKIETSSYYTYSFMSKDILESMILSEGMDFYSALQSVNNQNEWIFVERDMKNTSYNLFFYNQITKTKNLIFSQDNSPDSKYAFIPFAWSKDIVYMEAKVFGSATENEGIWSYNITTKQFSKLQISSSYISTPIISPDGTKFIYGGTKDINKDLNSPMNIIFVYDLNTNQEKTIVKDNNSWFSIYGWVEDNIGTTDLINIDEVESYLGRKKVKSEILQPSFKLPWNSGVSYCVSTGPYGVPPGPIGSSITCGSFTFNHNSGNYGIDFDSPNNVYDPVRAAAAGTVIYAQFNSNGYGNLVKIKHSDNTITYYAHLNSISVSVNDVVQQGCEIGDGGTTGDSTGDHIHFEWYDASGARFSSPTYPTFSECGCTPRMNYQYTSNNTVGACGIAPPSNDNPCDAGVPTLPVGTSCNYATKTIIGATKSTQIADASCDQPSNVDVWFKFTIPSGTFSIHTNSISISSNDCGLAIYTGSCSSMTERYCIKGGNPSQSYMPWDDNISLSAYGGQTGYIRVWEFGTVSQTGDFQICVTSNVVNYTISTSSSPSAGGTTSGSGTYQSGQSRTVTASENSGYSFSNWTENGSQVSANASYTFTLTGNRTLVANFIPDIYTISTSSNPPAGGTTSGSGSYQSGQSRTVTATANSGYTFSNWTENGSQVSANASYTFTLSGNRTLVANFLIITYTLTVNATNGTVAKNPNQTLYNYGSTVQVTATASIGYIFTSWSGDATGTNPSVSVIMNSNKNVTANFTPDILNYTIFTSSNPSVGGSTSGSGTYQSGQSRTVTATPSVGYVFVNWTEGGVSVSSSATYQLAPLVANRTLVANFSIITYTLTVNATNGGTVAKNPNQTLYNYGSTVQVTATASTGYTFTGWTGNATGNANPLSVTMDQNKTITANFTPDILYSISTSSNPSVGGTTSGSGTFIQNSVKTVTASPNIGYTFTNWTEGGTLVSTNASYNFTLTGNRTLVANFTPDIVNYPTIYTLSNPPAGGTTSGSGTFIQNSVNTVTASPNTGYTFVNWTEGGTSVSTNASYTFTLSGNRTLVANFTNNSCTPPYNGIISPSNPSVTAGNSINLTVTANGPTPFTYQWYWWNGSDWTVLTNSSPYSGVTTQTLNINSASTSMNGNYYTCLVSNSCGSQNDISYVQLAVISNFCAAGSTDAAEYISNVAIGNINQASDRGTAGYQDNTSLITTMQIGVNTTATITVTNPYPSDQVLIWIDWNQDGDFDEAGENVYASTGSFASPHTTANFAPPAGAETGITRMRIRLHDTGVGAGPNATSCGNSAWGEVEDYSVYVANATATPTVSDGGSIRIYPNPTTGKFEISEIETLGNECKVEIINNLGSLIYISVYKNFGNKISLDLSPYTKGLYLIRLSNNEVSYQKKVIKK